MIRNNALWNCQNPHQGKYKRVLTVCSAGLLRSPTIAWFLGQYDYNCRAAGIHDYALVPLDEVLIMWADIIICADQDKYDYILSAYSDESKDKKIYNFNIPDQYAYRQEELVELIKEQCSLVGLVNG